MEGPNAQVLSQTQSKGDLDIAFLFVCLVFDSVLRRWIHSVENYQKILAATSDRGPL